MKKNRKWMLWVSGLLAVALVGGVIGYFALRPGKPVHVYNIEMSGISMDKWMEDNSSYGWVKADKLQTVYVSDTQEVTGVLVREGQKVQKGQKLMTYDTTLSQLTLDRKKLDVEKYKMRLETAKEQRKELNKERPIRFVPKPTTPPTTHRIEGIDYQPVGTLTQEFEVYDGVGTAKDPARIWIQESNQLKFDDAFWDKVIDGKPTPFYATVEAREKNQAREDVRFRFLAIVDREEEIIPGTRSQEPELTEEPTVEEEPVLEPAEPIVEDETEPEIPPETGETEETEPEPTDSEPTDPEPSDPEPTDPPVVTVTRYNVTIRPAPPEGAIIRDEPQSPEYEQIGNYTQSEITQMKAEKDAEIKELEFAVRMAQSELKIMEKEVDNGVVLSDFAGYVVSVLSPEQAAAEKKPLIKISGGGGYQISGTVNELARDQLQIGQTVEVMNWATGVPCEGRIASIGDMPVENNSGGMGNPLTSYYPFVVTVEESVDLEPDTPVEITYALGEDEEQGFYLDSAFIRSENGTSYVYVANAEGLLEKREVRVGTGMHGWTNILSGLESWESIAFPYDGGLKDGAPTVESDIQELYAMN